MAEAPAPLFTTPGSVYRRTPHPWQDEDEAAVDASIPSTPIDETEGFGTPPFSSSPPARAHHVKPESCDEQPSTTTTPANDATEAEVMTETQRDMYEDTPIRELGEEGPVPVEADRICRICFAGADEEDTLGKLISPCLCTGSMRVSRF